MKKWNDRWTFLSHGNSDDFKAYVGFWTIMTKYEIKAMTMRNENLFYSDPFNVTAKLATCLEKLGD